MKFSLRFHKQETPYSCVPACLRIVLSGFGIDLTESELRNLCDCTPLGTEALKAVDAVRQLGLKKTVKLTLSWGELTGLVNSGSFPIVFVNLLPIDGIKGGHALVALRVEIDKISVYDPLQGERILKLEIFTKAWAMMHNLAILVQN